MTSSENESQSTQQEEIGLFEAIYTQRGIRYLKPDPIPNEILYKLIQAATKAPSATNRQTWRFIVIRDAEVKQRIGEVYKRTFEELYGPGAVEARPVDFKMFTSGLHLAEHIHEAPVMIMACIEQDNAPSEMSRAASIYPAVQNLLLAARGLGIGAILTTNHKHHEAEVKEILGIPARVDTAALIPLGYPADDANYGPTRRKPVEDVTFFDRWGGAFEAN